MMLNNYYKTSFSPGKLITILFYSMTLYLLYFSEFIFNKIPCISQMHTGKIYLDNDSFTKLYIDRKYYLPYTTTRAGCHTPLE